MVLKMEAKKEHGLLFQPNMARANVAGLKTMTRRGNGLKEINVDPEKWRFDGWISDTTGSRKEIGRAAWSPASNDQYDISGGVRVKCPWQVGDLIYQKERWDFRTWAVLDGKRSIIICYGADGKQSQEIQPSADWNPTIYNSDRWRSSLFMPKWAARFWAEIVSIKVERVRDISAEDCIKEGIQERNGGFMVGYTLPEYGPQPVGIVHKTPVATYKELYDGINGPGSFDRDWCWVIEYRRVER